MVKVLPMLHDIKKRLIQLENGIYGVCFLQVHNHTTIISSATLRHLESIEIHNLWCAACVLHPYLANFSFMPSLVRREYRSKGESLIQKMMS